jgi:hypothetical protein
VEHVQANAAASDWELTPDEINTLNKVLESR